MKKEIINIKEQMFGSVCGFKGEKISVTVSFNCSDLARIARAIADVAKTEKSAQAAKDFASSIETAGYTFCIEAPLPLAHGYDFDRGAFFRGKDGKIRYASERPSISDLDL